MSPQITFLESNDETRFFEVTSSPDYHFRKHFCKHMKAVAEATNITDSMVYAEVKSCQ